MIEFDSHSTKSPSLMTGTSAFGFRAMNSGACVERKPVPQSSRVKGRFSSAQVHSTLRTLMDEVLPRISIMARAW
jgi:hypothetical protein